MNLGEVPRGELLVGEGQARVLVHLEAEVEPDCGMRGDLGVGVWGDACVR